MERSILTVTVHTPKYTLIYTVQKIHYHKSSRTTVVCFNLHLEFLARKLRVRILGVEGYTEPGWGSGASWGGVAGSRGARTPQIPRIVRGPIESYKKHNAHVLDHVCLRSVGTHRYLRSERCFLF